MSLDYMKKQINDLRSKADAVNDDWIRADKETDADEDLSAAGKEAQRQETAEAFRGELRSLKEQERTLIADKRKSLYRSLFGLSVSASDDPIQIVGYRDAQDRAARLEDEIDAQEMLNTAELSGDTVQAAAVLARAVGRWPAIVRRYTDEHPGSAEELRDLSEIAQYDSFTAAMAYASYSPGVS